jgi:opacity protein-like surface antigen
MAKKGVILALLLTCCAGVFAQDIFSAISKARGTGLEQPENARLWTVGVSAGTSFADPWLIGTIRGTIAPLPFSFLEVGFDAGFISNKEWADGYYSLYPFAHYALFLPFAGKGGWYIGAGGGYMLREYRVEDWSESGSFWAADFTTGFNIGNVFDISYTLRTNFDSAGNKIAVGYTYRFLTREQRKEKREKSEEGEGQ